LLLLVAVVPGCDTEAEVKQSVLKTETVKLSVDIVDPNSQTKRIDSSGRSIVASTGRESAVLMAASNETFLDGDYGPAIDIKVKNIGADPLQWPVTPTARQTGNDKVFRAEWGGEVAEVRGIIVVGQSGVKTLAQLKQQVSQGRQQAVATVLAVGTGALLGVAGAKTGTDYSGVAMDIGNNIDATTAAHAVAGQDDTNAYFAASHVFLQGPYELKPNDQVQGLLLLARIKRGATTLVTVPVGNDLHQFYLTQDGK